MNPYREWKHKCKAHNRDLPVPPVPPSPQPAPVAPVTAAESGTLIPLDRFRLDLVPPWLLPPEERLADWQAWYRRTEPWRRELRRQELREADGQCPDSHK